MSKKLLFSLLLNLLLIGVIFFIMHKLGGPRYVYLKMKNRGSAGVYMHRKNIFEKLPQDSTDVVFLGNSLTEQGPWEELFPQVDLKNRGIATDMTDGILDRLETVTAMQPEKLFISIGVNDLLFHKPDYILRNYEKILDNISRLSPSTKVFVQSLLPVNNEVRTTGVYNKDIQIINRKLEELCQAKGLTFIKLHTHFANAQGKLKEEFTLDGIHLNGAAYLLWRDLLSNWVES